MIQTSKARQDPDSLKKVLSIRMAIREKQYLSNPFEEPHKNLNGELLDDNLVNFTEIALSNFRKFVQCKNSNQKYEHQVVFITMQERNDAENKKTKEHITTNIFNIIKQLPNPRLYADIFNHDIKNKTKKEHLDFYHKIKEILER